MKVNSNIRTDAILQSAAKGSGSVVDRGKLNQQIVMIGLCVFWRILIRMGLTLTWKSFPILFCIGLPVCIPSGRARLIQPGQS